MILGSSEHFQTNSIERFQINLIHNTCKKCKITEDRIVRNNLHIIIDNLFVCLDPSHQNVDSRNLVKRSRLVMPVIVPTTAYNDLVSMSEERHG